MTRDLLFEIGVEELPASYVQPALEQLEREVRGGLAELRLAFGDLCTYATPRRLALFVKDLADRQSDHDEEVTGPAVRVAFDAAGKPTRALLGFCQGRGVDPAAVRRVATAKGEYVAVTVHHAGLPAAEVLPGLLGGVAQRLAFPKTMRWPGSEARFARPVRWLVALFGTEIVPVRAFGLEAGRHSRGHRFLRPDPIEVPRPEHYLETLERAFVLADHRARRLVILEQVEKVAAQVGGKVVEDEELVDINNFLVEWPTAFAGSFDPRHHDLPNEVIITALREHQSFFAVQDLHGGSGGALLADKFIAVRNGDSRNLDRVRAGNESVLAARLEDAEFYWKTDLKRTPEQQVAALDRVVWMEGLGSLREKAARLEGIGGWLAGRLAPEEAATVRRAALLCKTDLLSEMIGSGKEYASLQGVIGGYYAKRAGEPAAVCDAIYWHYHPRSAGDALPQTTAGSLLALADKLDHVAGAFVAGKVPSGSEDPYGVRRAGNGVVRILIDQERNLDLRDAAGEATRPFLAGHPGLEQDALLGQLAEFWRDRVEAALEERGISYDAREAALEARRAADGGPARPGWVDPFDCLLRARALAAFRGDERFESLVILFKRVGNILRAATETIPPRLDPARLAEPAERTLHAAFERACKKSAPLWQRRAYAEILPALLDMEREIHDFFDQVLVNTDDMPTRLNRLRLLTEVQELFLRGWDLSKVVVEGEKP